MTCTRKNKILINILLIKSEIAPGISLRQVVHRYVNNIKQDISVPLKINLFLPGM